MLWYRELTTALEDLGLMPVPGVNCLYANSWLILFFYVDDIVILSTKQNADKLQEFEKALLMKFQMRALGDLNWFLGIRIIRDRDQRKIWLCQDSYISKVAAKFNLEKSKNFTTPLAEVPRENNSEIETSDQMIYAYQQRIGSLNFAAVITRPDIAWATSRLSQFLKQSSQQHMDAANRVISYLNCTKHLAIEYSWKITSNIFNCASDAAFGDDDLTRRSSDGFLFQLYGGAIDWRAAKQTTVTTSSTEAELLAISRTAKKAIWWRRFFENIRFDTEETLVIKCDNQPVLNRLGRRVRSCLMGWVSVTRNLVGRSSFASSASSTSWLRRRFRILPRDSLGRAFSAESIVLIKLTWVFVRRSPRSSSLSSETRRRYLSAIINRGLSADIDDVESSCIWNDRRDGFDASTSSLEPTLPSWSLLTSSSKVISSCSSSAFISAWYCFLTSGGVWPIAHSSTVWRYMILLHLCSISIA